MPGDCVPPGLREPVPSEVLSSPSSHLETCRYSTSEMWIEINLKRREIREKNILLGSRVSTNVQL